MSDLADRLIFYVALAIAAYAVAEWLA